MPKVKSLEDFLIAELKDLYSAEKQIVKALPKMLKAATAEELKEAFQKPSCRNRKSSSTSGKNF